MKINKEWHLLHPMPKNPNIEQRISWHLEHAVNCSCRVIPVSIIEEIKREFFSLKPSNKLHTSEG